MNKLRIFASSFFALTMVLSIVGYNPSAIQAETSTSDPVLESAEAKNTGGTSAKEAGDTVILEFSESTDKPTIDASNITTFFTLDNGHSFLDGAGALGTVLWSEDGEELEIALSAGTSLPSVVPGDEVTIVEGSIEDLDGNDFTGDVTISGSFSAAVEEECETPTPTPTVTPSPSTTPTPTASPTVSATVSGNNDGDDDDEEDEDEDSDDDDCDHQGERGRGKFRCGIGLQNGRLYKLASSPTVYLLAACRFKPFRGAAAFHSRGLKFQDIVVLDAFPAGMTVSDQPVVPAEGTLVKGSDKTVWFVGKNGKRKGFTSAEVFQALGFKFDKVDQITDSDLSTISSDTPISDANDHPDGALIKCGNSAAVFVVIGNLRFPFANADAFLTRGHSFDHILNVDCGRFAYREGAPVTQ